VTLVSDLSDLSDLSDKLVRHGITRGCACRCGVGRRGQIYRRGMHCLLDSNGGVQAAAVWRRCLTCLTCRTCRTKWCATVYPRGVQGAVWFGAGRKCAAGVCGQCDGNGGVRAAGACRLCRTCRTCRTKWCATVYPVGLHAAVWFGAGRKCAAGVQ